MNDNPAGANPAGGKSPNPQKQPKAADVALSEWLDWLEQDPSFDQTRRRVGKKLVMVGLIDDPR